MHDHKREGKEDREKEREGHARISTKISTEGVEERRVIERYRTGVACVAGGKRYVGWMRRDVLGKRRLWIVSHESGHK